MQASVELKGNYITVKQNKEVLYTGTREIYNREATFSFKNTDSIPVITINEYKSFFKTTYDIITYKDIRKSHDMINKSLWKGYWIINDEDYNYEIVSHPGVKISIYKNDLQIATIIRQALNFLNIQTIFIHYNKNENMDLLIGIAVAMFGGFYNNGNALTINLGHIGPQMKKFDKNWVPKN